jgi:hypothetical protein
MNFDEVLRVFLRVISDWRVLAVTAALLLYLAIMVFASGIRKKAAHKRQPKEKSKLNFKIKMPTIKMPKFGTRKKDAEASDDDDEIPSRRRAPIGGDDDDEIAGNAKSKKKKKSK